jgi:hypothetical protein
MIPFAVQWGRNVYISFDISCSCAVFGKAAEDAVLNLLENMILF